MGLQEGDRAGRAGRTDRTTRPRVLRFEDLTSSDVPVVGGKNASLGEMTANLTARGVRVPIGFATTAAAYEEFLGTGGLRDAVRERIDALHAGAPLAETGREIRELILATALPQGLAEEVTAAYRQLAARLGRTDPDVAVRSSATAEDLPEASFAGQQETFLGITGEERLLDACRRCYASLFTDRAINYREEHGFDHLRVALSVGVQEMVRSDLAGAGVMFTLDTDSGFPRVVLVNAAYGLGESVVSGRVDPDEYLVFKPLLGRAGCRPVISRTAGGKQSKIVYADGGGGPGGDPTEEVATSAAERSSCVLTEDEILTLAEWAVAVEEHYGCPMDLEWAKDGRTGELSVVQARPETVQARKSKEAATLRSYRLTGEGRPLVTGLAVGDAVATGRVCRLRSARDIAAFEDGSVLVTGATDPDWEPIMKRAAAIVTDRGGRTSHAAIVSRELGLPAVVGTGGATAGLHDGQEVTVSCAEGEEGRVYAGAVDYEEREIALDRIERTRTRVMLNLANPSAAFRWWRLPADGVGLARMEFVVNNHIKIHPLALIHPEALADAPEHREARERIEELTRGYPDKTRYFVDRLAYGIARIAAAWWPKPVIVRMSDFKTNEYAKLIGGGPFEPGEENPMLGWRGASRYDSDGYREGFALECRAVRRVREEMGLTNTVVMIPFCRTLDEADRVLATLAEHGLARGSGGRNGGDGRGGPRAGGERGDGSRGGLEVYVMAEIPSNIVLAEEFADRFDGFSVGSNDLTQLTLGIDRDSELLAQEFDERDPSVTRSIEHLIEVAHRKGRKAGLCGQRPSDDPDFARFLVAAGIDSISVTPDSFLAVKEHVARAEREDRGTAAGRREGDRAERRPGARGATEDGDRVAGGRGAGRPGGRGGGRRGHRAEPREAGSRRTGTGTGTGTGDRQAGTGEGRTGTGEGRTGTGEGRTGSGEGRAEAA
ncbi:phosphoenolpyruvate synthase [Streptomyces zingiberis]|uniref:phosphoenolpyruvate synthase n=1 Tax=Streptomyces zingiberis TaxID=2053010 RepID=UPI0019D00E3D|nr:phosphoenolpyruvate synthase [Streptomyces zingiberis]